MSDSWYYLDANRQQQGPFTIEAIQAKTDDKLIQGSTLIWPGEGEWVEASKSDLQLPNVEKHENVLADIELRHEVKNTWAWLSVLISSVLAFLTSSTTSPDRPHLEIFLFMAIFLFFDQRSLKKSIGVAPHIFWVILGPVFLWKRESLLKRKNKPIFWASIFALLVLSQLAGA